MIREELSSINQLPKLRWACRRGMLELDVLLGNFLEDAYADLPSAQKNNFVTLLETPDPVLFAWLMGHAIPDDPALATIAMAIRQHALSRI